MARSAEMSPVIAKTEPFFWTQRAALLRAACLAATALTAGIPAVSAAALSAAGAAQPAATPQVSRAVIESPRALLLRMEQTLSTRNYRGVFVRELGGRSESLKIVHRVSEGKVWERVAALDGTGREFIRKDGELTYYLPDQKLVMVEAAAGESALLGDLRRLDAASSGHYRLRELAPARSNNRLTRVIEVEPLDQYRYGYKLWIDDGSAMPVKSQLLASGKTVVEQITFTELSLLKSIADAQLTADVDTSGFRQLRYDRKTAVAAVSNAGDWQLEQLPPGYRITARSAQAQAGAQQPVTQLVFSDGLARVSVFVEQTGASASAAASSLVQRVGNEARLGSSSVYSTTVPGYRLTAIGEAPPDAVRAIARSLRPPAGGSRQR